MNPYPIISKLDNGIPLNPEESKYLIDLVDEQEEYPNFPVWIADIVFVSLLLTAFTLGAWIF